MLSITNKILKNNQYLNKLIIKPLSSSSILSSILINNDRNNFKRFYMKKPTISHGNNSMRESERIKDIDFDQDELDEEYLEKDMGRKLEKSKREINKKKKVRVSPLDIYLSETNNIKEPQVDLIDGDQLHVFPPPKRNHGMSSSSRYKENPIHTQRTNNREPDVEIEEEYPPELLSSRNELDLDEDDDNNLIDGEEDPQDLIANRKTPFIKYPRVDDYDDDAEEAEFYDAEDEDDDEESPDIIALDLEEERLMREKEMKELRRWEKEIEGSKRKRKVLLDAGFVDQEILSMYQKPKPQVEKSKRVDKRSTYIKHKPLSNVQDIKDLSIRLFDIDSEREARTYFNDDVLDKKSVQLIDVDGTNIGIMDGPKAYRLAFVKKLDIFLSFGSNGNIYARLMTLEDYIRVNEKKIEQEKEKKENEATKSTKSVLISSNISENDRITKFDHIRKFLLKRHCVEVTITYKEERKDDDETPINEDGHKIFALLDPILHGIGKVQSKFEKGGQIVSRFYQPLTVKEREAHLKKIERNENSQIEKLKEKLERDEIDRLDELGLEIDPIEVAAAVAANLKRIQMAQELEKENITQAEFDLLEELEKEKEKKRKEREEKFKLAPESGEGLSNKQIKQNKNKNKNLEKKLKNKNKKNNNNDDDELF
ncbi:hypothetical protein ACTFIV_009012 [Dictyostelium citrinum]